MIFHLHVALKFELLIRMPTHTKIKINDPDQIGKCLSMRGELTQAFGLGYYVEYTCCCFDNPSI